MILSNIVKAVYNEQTKKYDESETFYKDLKEISEIEFNDTAFKLRHKIMYDKIETYYLNDGWETRYTKIMED